MTILFSTHILGDVERICDYVGILDQGRLAVSGSLDELKQQYAKNQIEIEFSHEADLKIFTSKLSELRNKGVLKDFSFDPSKNLLILSYTQAYEEVAPLVFRIFESCQIFPNTIKKIDPSLETIFLEVVQ